MTQTQMIRVCSNEHEVIPLIATFAFRGAEFWCPMCGGKAGWFDPTEEAEATPELIALRKVYRERAEPYLRYRASLSGGVEENKEGRLVPIEAEAVEYEYHSSITLESEVDDT